MARKEADLEEEIEEEEEETTGRGQAAKKGRSKAKAKSKLVAKGKLKPSVKAKGKAQGKAKASAKSKGQVRRKKADQADQDGESGIAAEKPKPKAKGSLKSRILQQIGDRDVNEVLEEVREEVSACNTAITNAEQDQQRLQVMVEHAEKEMEQAGQAVDEALAKETEALEQFKKLKAALGTTFTSSHQAQVDRTESEKNMKFLEIELDSRRKMHELEAAKTAARVAAEKAKQMLEESKAKEKEADLQLRRSLVEQREKEAEAMKHFVETDKGGAESKKAGKAAEKKAQKDVQVKMAEIEKARVQRDKDRRKRWCEAAGLKVSKGRALKALMITAASESSKRPALPTMDEPADKIQAYDPQDVD